MPVVEVVCLVALLIAEGAQLVGRSFLRQALRFFPFIAIGAVFLILSYAAMRQYDVWRVSPFSRFLLPPYQPSWYFAYYVGMRVFAPWVLTFAAAYGMSRFAAYWDKKTGGRFFHEGETTLFLLGIFLSGYPAFLFYFPILLIAALILSAYYSISGKGRVSLYYLWLPAAIFAILVKQAIPSSFLNNFIL